MDDLTERIARAMIAYVRPSHQGNPRDVDLDEWNIDFVEMAKLALDEVMKDAASCGVCGCAVYKGLPNAVSRS